MIAVRSPRERASIEDVLVATDDQRRRRGLAGRLLGGCRAGGRRRWIGRRGAAIAVAVAIGIAAAVGGGVGLRALLLARHVCRGITLVMSAAVSKRMWCC
jgi:hypothetical protein